MAQFRYIGDDNREVSMLPSGVLRPVEPDEVFTVPDEHAESYEIQPHYFERQDEPKPTKATAKTKETD